MAAAVAAASANIGADPAELARGLPNLAALAEEASRADPALLGTALWAMLETLQMAFVGTAVGVAAGLPLGLLASRNLYGRAVHAPVRALLAAVRTFPSILWAILFVIVVGPGPFAGVLAIVMYTVGFVTKLQYESVEAVDRDPVEAAAAAGVPRWKLIRHVVLPESAPHLLGHALYMFDYNVRQTSILGLVGAGGIGFYIITYIKHFEYGSAAVFMGVVLAAVLAIDYASVRVRDRYIARPAGARRRP